MKDVNSWQAKFEPCQYAGRLIGKLLLLNKATNNPVDIQEVKKAIYYARKYHGDQKRLSGEPYYSHPIEVAYMVSDYLFRTDVIVTAILHDTIEDTEMTAGMILDIFGRRVEEMVDMLTRNRPDGSKLSVEQILINAYDKKDKQVLLIKTIDRLHNMQTIGSMSAEKIEKIINETLINFVLLSECLELTYTAKKIQQICIETKKKPILEKNLYADIFSFNDNYQPLSLIYQNDIRQ